MNSMDNLLEKPDIRQLKIITNVNPAPAASVSPTIVAASSGSILQILRDVLRSEALICCVTGYRPFHGMLGRSLVAIRVLRLSIAALDGQSRCPADLLVQEQQGLYDYSALSVCGQRR